jgi:hypothetical protein
MVRPLSYTISPPYTRLANLLRISPEERGRAGGREGVATVVDTIAGLTAVDGAAVIDDRFNLLAFGVKIGRREGHTAVGQVMLAEPVVDDPPALVAPVQIGGTRHLSAAQFVHDQRECLALVASQDGRFTVFAWSTIEAMVMAHGLESLLL